MSDSHKAPPVPFRRGPITSQTYEWSAQQDDKRRTSELPELIEQTEGAMTADELAPLLNVSRITLFKRCAAGKIPCFRIGTSVRFDPVLVARWLRSLMKG